MSLRSILVFASASVLVALSPGPNVFLVLSQGLRSGLGAVLKAIAGIELAPLIYLTISSLGLGYLLAMWPNSLSTIRLLGALYLAYIGFKMCRKALATPGGSTSASLRGRTVYAQGFLTSFSNPKTILYFSAFLPQFIDGSQPATPQLVTFGLVGVALEAVVLLGYGTIAAKTRHVVAGPAFARRIDLYAGAFLALLGAYLVWLEVGTNSAV